MYALDPCRVIKDFYVDDLISDADSVEDLEKITVWNNWNPEIKWAWVNKVVFQSQYVYREVIGKESWFWKHRCH